MLKQRIDQVAPVREVRKIRGLKWAELRDYGPFPDAKQKNQKACVKKGHAYERAVLREIKRLGLNGETVFQQWIMFADENGLGWARPDLYILLDDVTLVIEAKLTQTRTAETQLISLYLPLLQSIYQTPMLLLQAFRTLRSVPKRLVDGPEDFLQHPGPGVHTWHYIGN